MLLTVTDVGFTTVCRGELEISEKKFHTRIAVRPETVKYLNI